MSVRRTLIPLALALLAVRCSDERRLTGVPLSPAPHAVRWAGGVAPHFILGNRPSSEGDPGGLQIALSNGLSLERNTASFWAVRGKTRSVQINYLSSTGNTTVPFLQLSIEDPNYVPGRGNLHNGDSVLVTVTVDADDIGVSLEPTGMRFDGDSKLTISYGGANGDLNGDGVVNDADADIESRLLGLWYREGAGSAWSRMTASRSGKSFSSKLQHFSEYAVSFLEYAVSW